MCNGSGAAVAARRLGPSGPGPQQLLQHAFLKSKLRVVSRRCLAACAWTTFWPAWPGGCRRTARAWTSSGGGERATHEQLCDAAVVLPQSRHCPD